MNKAKILARLKKNEPQRETFTRKKVQYEPYLKASEFLTLKFPVNNLTMISMHLKQRINNLFSLRLVYGR